MSTKPIIRLFTKPYLKSFSWLKIDIPKLSDEISTKTRKNTCFSVETKIGFVSIILSLNIKLAYSHSRNIKPSV